MGTMTGAASAATCTITTTGPGSNNTCTVNDSNVVSVTCTNGVNVANVNLQTAVSGGANVSGNTISGTATSGNAENINTTATQLAVFCAAAPAATPAPAAPAGGQGAGPAPVTPAATATPAPVTVKALPNTGSSNVLTMVGISALVLGAIAAATQFALAGYRRSGN